MISKRMVIIVFILGFLMIASTSFLLTEKSEKDIHLPVAAITSYKSSPYSDVEVELMDISSMNEVAELVDNIVLAECINISPFDQYIDIYEFEVLEQMKGVTSTETIDVYIGKENENYIEAEQYILFLGRFDSALYKRTAFSPASIVINTTQMTTADEFDSRIVNEINGKTLEEIKKYITALPGCNDKNKNLPVEVQDYAGSVEELIDSSEVAAYISINDLEYINPSVSEASIEFLHFFKGECNVERMLVPGTAKEGSYIVFLYQEDKNWYRLVTRYDSLIPVKDEKAAFDYFEQR